MHMDSTNENYFVDVQGNVNIFHFTWGIYLYIVVLIVMFLVTVTPVSGRENSGHEICALHGQISIRICFP